MVDQVSGMNTAPFLGVVGDAAFPPTKSLQDVVPSVRPQFEALISYATSLGLKPKIRSAGRTCEEQAEQLKLGYSDAGLCRSMHTLGHAVDLDLSPNTCESHTKLGVWWEARGGVWGGRWKQFGACGDMGHYHFGFNGAGAVPTSVCPADVTLAQCKQLRKDYLTQAFSSGGGVSSNMGLLAGLAIVGAAGLILWGTLRVKPGARSNPKGVSLQDKAVQAMQLYMGSEGLPVKTQQRFYDKAMKLVDQLVARHGMSRSNVFDQISNEAIRRGKIYPRPAKDY